MTKDLITQQLKTIQDENKDSRILLEKILQEQQAIRNEIEWEQTFRWQLADSHT